VAADALGPDGTSHAGRVADREEAARCSFVGVTLLAYGVIKPARLGRASRRSSETGLPTTCQPYALP